jgi:hypothetical protein
MPVIDHPAYYREDTGHEAIAVIEAWGLGFRLGNAVKYISRAGLKGSKLDDLKKARWYLDREIQAIEAEADEREAEAEDAESRPRFYAKPKMGKVGIVDEDGDARWIMSREDAMKMADTLEWGVRHAGDRPRAILDGDAPEVWMQDGKIWLQWGVIGTCAMLPMEARALSDSLRRVVEGMP